MASDTLLLSVIVPITGPPNRIANLLRWLPQFEELNGEIILVHDVRDLATVELLTKTVNENIPKLNLKLIEGHFGSPGAARNEGMRNAQGTWITFWDCDDIPNLKNTKELLNGSMDSKIDFICGSFDVIDSTTHLSLTAHVNSGKPDIDLKRVGLNPGIWRFIFKRSSIEKLYFLAISMAEDQDFLLDFNLTARQGLYSPKITYSYYIGAQGQLTRTKVAFNDLPVSIKHIDACRKMRGRDIYLETIYLRQLLTGMLRSSLRIRIFCSYKFFLNIFSLINKDSMGAFIQVFSTSNRKLINHG
jgi:glycosyltransferase involved in cell wall biosynthesis